MLNLNTILCPIDFSEPCLLALRKTVKLLSPEAEFILLHVRMQDPAAATIGDTNSEELVRSNIVRMIADFLPPEMNARALVLSGDVTSQIVHAAIAENCDLIVMPTHGATGWREFALGSIADEVVRLAPCPVLTLNKAALARRDEDPRDSGVAEVSCSRRGKCRDCAILAQPVPPDSCVEAAFPLDGSPQAKLRFLLHYAILAPSNRNSQPWLWRFNGDAVELYADRMRAMPYLDPVDRELILSCGAALMHLRLAIRHFGYKAEVETFPHPEVPDLLARVRLGDLSEPPEGENLLFKGIFSRHTNRASFMDRELPATLLKDLEAEAREEGASLFIIEDAAKRHELIELVAAADLSQKSSAEFLSEDWKWIHTISDIHVDGLQESSLRQTAILNPGHPATAQADTDRLLGWSAPVLAVLETLDDTPQDWLAAGQAVARLLLRAGAEGVQANFFNSPVEVRSMWPRLHHLLQHASLPQIILRLGYPTSDAAPTPRRPLNDVLH